LTLTEYTVIIYGYVASSKTPSKATIGAGSPVEVFQESVDQRWARLDTERSFA
jgi:hypothetical protein